MAILDIINVCKSAKRLLRDDITQPKRVAFVQEFPYDGISFFVAPDMVDDSKLSAEVLENHGMTPMVGIKGLGLLLPYCSHMKPKAVTIQQKAGPRDWRETKSR